MVGIGRRMNKLKAQLLQIRHGPGAALLPSEVTRIHLEFSKRWDDGQYGPRKFWQTYMRRLKYWNPAVPMIVNRTTETSGPATLTIYFRQQAGNGSAFAADSQPSSSFVGKSKAPEPSPAERTVQIDVKGLWSDAIYNDFLVKTGAVPIAPTSEEQEELREIKDRVERSNTDREIMHKYLSTQRREAAMLAQAKSEVEAMKNA